jgi:hypothetical protein
MDELEVSELLNAAPLTAMTQTALSHLIFIAGRYRGRQRRAGKVSDDRRLIMTAAMRLTGVFFRSYVRFKGILVGGR